MIKQEAQKANARTRDEDPEMRH